MNKKQIIHFLFFLIAGAVAAQEKNIIQLENEFQSFNYRNVINLADEILKEKTFFTNDELQQIYLLKGISQFSLNDERGARESFIELLKIDENYKPDPVEVSPKIIRFFEDVKNEYLQIMEEEPKEQIVKVDTIFVKEPVYIQSNLKNILSRSVVWPGWGHLYSGQKTKGILLTAVSAGLIGGSIYFAIDAREKEKDYLSETQTKIIQQKYEDYNKAYKTRNIFLFSYLAVWLYSQSDILFFNPPENLKLNLKKDNNQNFNLNFKYYF